MVKNCAYCETLFRTDRVIGAFCGPTCAGLFYRDLNERQRADRRRRPIMRRIVRAAIGR